MLKNEVFPTYRNLSKELTKVYNEFQKYFREDSIQKLCELRGYPLGESPQEILLKELNIGYLEVGNEEQFKSYPDDLSLYSKRGRLLLNNRYIIPVTTPSNDLVSLIGYFPDDRKYITLPTPFFSKEVLFFNFHQAYELSWGTYNGFVILVEGIFDCLSLRSIGLPCIATMGSTVSKLKGELLKVFNKVLAIPDDDEVGRSALDRNSKKGWKVPYNTTMIKFKGGITNIGGEDLHCKDMDNFVTWYSSDDIKDILLYYKDSKEDIEEIIL